MEASASVVLTMRGAGPSVSRRRATERGAAWRGRRRRRGRGGVVGSVPAWRAVGAFRVFGKRRMPGAGEEGAHPSEAELSTAGARESSGLWGSRTGCDPSVGGLGRVVESGGRGAVASMLSVLSAWARSSAAMRVWRTAIGTWAGCVEKAANGAAGSQGGAWGGAGGWAGGPWLFGAGSVVGPVAVAVLGSCEWGAAVGWGPGRAAGAPLRPWSGVWPIVGEAGRTGGGPWSRHAGLCQV